MLDDDKLELIYQYFQQHGLQWKIKGVLRQPARNEISMLIEDLIAAVKDEGDISIEIGSILVKRSGPKIDIYVHAGDVDFNE